MTDTRRKSLFIRIFTVFIAAVFAALAFTTFTVSAQVPRGKVDNAGRKIADVTYSDAPVGLDNDYINGSEPLNGVTPAASDLVTVIVTLDGTPMMQYASEHNTTVAHALDTVAGRANLAKLNSIKTAALGSVSKYIVERRLDYTTVTNAFSATVRYGDIKKIEAGNHVRSVIMDESYLAPEAVTENYVDVYSTGIFDSSDVGYDGTGTVVAVLDTGTDYTHEVFDMALDPDTMAISKSDVAAVAPYLAATSMSAAKSETIDEDDLYLTSKLPFAYDYADADTNVYPFESHGTHVAGIIAGQSDTITGVAPRAQIATFKVFADIDTGAKTEWILAGLNDAVTLGVDVINMSLGTSCGFAREVDEDEVNYIYDAINDAGICLVVAASNSYSSAQNSTWGNTNLASNPDSGTLGSPASYPASLAVASVSGVKTKYFTVNGKEIYFAESRLVGKNDANDFVAGLLGDNYEGEFEYVVVPGVGLSVNYSDIDVKGKIAVVRRGQTSFEEKVEVANRNGAIGVIVYNNVSGTVTMSVGTKELIPSCFVNMDLAVDLLENSEGTIKLSKDYLAGPFMSDFSSWGVLPDLQLSPDITAHGGEIYSAVAGGDLYDTYSGTSMACPNLAGALVLIRQYVKEQHPEYTTSQVRDESYSRMMSTATIVRNEDGNPYSPRKQGAGLADIASSIATTTYLTVDGSNKPKLSLGDDKSRTGEYTLTFNIVNTSGSAVSYGLSPYVMTESMSSDDRTVAEKAYMFDDTVNTYSVTARRGRAVIKGNTVTVGGYGEAIVTVNIKLSNADKRYLDTHFVNGMYVEGYVRLESYNRDTVDLGIPFLAFYGDWTDAPMLDITEYQVGESAADDSVLADEKLLADVYGTLPMAGFDSETAADGIAVVGLGSFSYIPATGYVAPPTQEKFAALTTSRDGSYLLYAIAAGLLRGAKRVDMEVRNSVTGELVWSGVDYNARKSYASGDQIGGYVSVELNISELNLPNNSKYTFNMACYLDVADENGEYTYGNNNTFSFEFTVDNEKPQLVDAAVREVETNGTKRRYLDLTMYDNHYIQGFSLSSYSGLGGEDGTTPIDMYYITDGVVPITSEYRGNTVVSYDITSYWDIIQQRNGTVYVTLYDYANNRNAKELKITPETDLHLAKTRTANDGYSIATNGQIDLKTYITVSANPDETLTEENASYVEGYWYDDNVVWGSTDPSVAEVKDGLVTGLKAGTTTVYALVKGKDIPEDGKDNAHYVAFEITVTSAEVAISISGMKMDPDAVTLTRGESIDVEATIEPYNYKGDVTITWSSTSVNVTVTPDPENPLKAKITGLQSGSATVRATIDGSRISGYCSVRVAQEFTMYQNVYLRSYTGRGDEHGKVEIPDDLGVTYIYEQAFMGNEYIREVWIPEGVTNIGRAAFVLCENLEVVHLPTTLTTIEAGAFFKCKKLKEINLQDVKTIADSAFSECTSLQSVEFGRTTYIAQFAFSNSGLTSLDLNRVGTVGGGAFMYCDGLTEVTIPASTTLNDTVGSFIRENGEEFEQPVGAFFGCGNLKKVTIYSKTVGVRAFQACLALEEVTFMNDVELIGSYAFALCSSLKTLDFRGSVYKIDDFAFVYCTSLKEITLPKGLSVLGALPFHFSELQTIHISADYKPEYVDMGSLHSGKEVQIEGTNNVYSDPTITAYTVDENNPYYTAVDGVLYSKDMTTLVAYPAGRGRPIKDEQGNEIPSEEDGTFEVPATVKTIGASAFYNATYLWRVDVKNVETIEEFAFANSGVNFLVVNVDSAGNSHGDYKIKYIGDGAFASSNIVYIPVSDATEYIGDSAFDGCYYITENFVAPKNLKYLGSRAFYNAGTANIQANDGSLLGNMQSISFAGSSIKEVGALAFFGCERVTKIDFGNIEVIGDGAFLSTAITRADLTKVKSLGNAAFYGCSSLTTVSLPNIDAIPAQAFMLTGLRNVILPATVKSIGESAFEGCTSLVSIKTVGSADYTIGGVTSIGEDAFAGCTALTTFIAPDATEIGDGAFSTGLTGYREAGTAADGTTIYTPVYENCTSLRSVAFDAAVSIGESAFEGCTALTDISFASLKHIGARAFAASTRLSYVSLGSVETIGVEAFDGCRALMSAAFGSVVSIGDRAFRGTAIMTFDVPSTATYIADNAFRGAKDLIAINVASGNSYYLSDSGVLYRINPNGYYTLICYPEQKTDASYTLLGNTAKIGAYAFADNTHITSVTLSVYMQSVGASAFDGTTSLVEIVINAPEAVWLESNFAADADPSKIYNNFGTVNASLKIIIPANSTLYDSYTWKQYVGSNIVTSTEYHVTLGTLSLIERIRALPETITAADAQEINTLVRLYNILNTTQQAFVRGNYAFTSSGNTIDGSYYTEVLGGTDYYALLTAAQEKLANLPVEPDHPIAQGGMTTTIVLAVFVGLLAVADIVLAVIFMLRRRRDNA